MTWRTQPRSEFGSLAAIERGRGTPVVLLHGVGLRAEAWAGVIAGLADTHHVIAPDLPGHGASQRADRLSSTARVAALTDQLAAALTLPAHIVGHSLGAMIALDLAVRYPASVRSVCACNAIYRRAPDAARAVAKRASRLDGAHAFDAAGTLSRWFAGATSPEREACAAWLSSVDPKGYKAAYAAFAQGDAPADPALRAIACPALFITGGRDPNSTAAMTRALADLVPNGRQIVIGDAAHMLPMTHHRDVTDALLSHCSEVDA
ncbi:MAG: alpha/beta hydrolase [Pseudomonadota bacterium]